MPNHRHRPAFRGPDLPFRGPADGARPNPAAHGGITFTESCTCGARRAVNVNGSHREIGRWYIPDGPNDTALTMNRYENTPDFEVWSIIVGGQTVEDFINGSPDEVELKPSVIDDYLNGSPLCDDLTLDERRTVAMKLARYIARG